MALLELRDLAVHYATPAGPVRAVDGATLDVPEAGIVGLVGESGCGKSTLGRAVMGVLPGSARIAGGAAVFEGRDLLGMPERERRALRWRRMAFIPQTAMNALDPVQRVGAQVAEVLTGRGRASRAEARARAAELFGMVGLDPGRLRDYPHQFSGGMRQRASIALALALDPALVIADEPVTALDVIVQRQVLDLLKDLQARRRLALILVTHDISVVAYLCDEVVPWVDTRYRTIPDRESRAISGKSSGGFGAMITPMLRPDLFGALATHAGDTLYEHCYLPDFAAAVRQPGQRRRVAVVDGGVGRLEQLEVDPVVRYADPRQPVPERLRSQVQVIVVLGAGVDPDRAQPAQGVGVPVHHPHRVPVQPPLPHVLADDPAAGVEGKHRPPVLPRRERGRAAERGKQ